VSRAPLALTSVSKRQAQAQYNNIIIFKISYASKPKNQGHCGQNGPGPTVQRICADKFVKQCKAKNTKAETEHGLTVKRIFSGSLLGPLGPRAPCMAGSAGAVVTPLIKI